MQGDSAYRELLEAAPDAIVIGDSGGRILLVNRQTERLFGYSREELVGQTRTPGPPPPTHTGPRILRWRELELDQAEHRVLIAGVELILRPLEVRLAATLLKSPGRSFTREELLQLVWGWKPDDKTRTVDTHVRRLRERLGAYGEAIETMHGFGYRWKPEEG